MAKFGYLWCFGANAASYGPLFFSVQRVRAPEHGRESPPGTANAAAMLRGVRNIVSHPKSGWALLSVFCTAFLCTPMITFAPVIIKKILQADVREFGNILTAFGAGGVLGPILILLLPRRLDRMKVSLWAAVLYGALLIVLSGAASLWQVAVLMVFGGVFLTVGNTSANTFLQSHATETNRGQTASLYMLAMRGGLSLGNLVMGAEVELSSLH